MPVTDSARVAVTRLKLSCAARVRRLNFIRKCWFTSQRIGAIATTTRNIFQSRHAITTAEKTICPNWIVLTKATSWIPARTASTSEVTRLMIRPSFIF